MRPGNSANRRLISAHPGKPSTPSMVAVPKMLTQTKRVRARPGRLMGPEGQGGQESSREPRGPQLGLVTVSPPQVGLRRAIATRQQCQGSDTWEGEASKFDVHKRRIGTHILRRGKGDNGSSYRSACQRAGSKQIERCVI